MALLNVTEAATAAGIGSTIAADGSCAFRKAVLAVPRGKPVIVMVHGYRFSPHVSPRDPHRHILSQRPDIRHWKAVSWPRHLHLHRPDAGLGIGFGWHAVGALPDVAKRARLSGTALAAMIRRIRALRPDLAIRIMAHSLGARVALAALRVLEPGDVQRVILIAGAEYVSVAEATLRAPGAARCEILNVISRENLVFDLLFRIAAPPSSWADMPLSRGMTGMSRWVDLPIDTDTGRAALLALGHRIRPPTTRVCHWSGYLRPGLFPVYRRVMDPAEAGFLRELGAALAGDRDAEPCQPQAASVHRA